jgi:hypothetical protein
LVCTYPGYNITFTISDITSIYGKWIEGLLEKYDAVIFARKFWKGVVFNSSEFYNPYIPHVKYGH